MAANPSSAVLGPLFCIDCETDLTKVSYAMYGTKVYDAETGRYEEEQGFGSGEMVVTCPNCSADVSDYLNEAEFNRLLL